MPRQIKVMVGSQNPTKVKAVRQAFQKVFPNCRIVVQSHDVKSQVRDHPITFTETILGANNRACSLFADYSGKADFFVGIEGGVDCFGGEWFQSNWVAIIDQRACKATASTNAFPLPQAFGEKIKAGSNLNQI